MVPVEVVFYPTRNRLRWPSRLIYLRDNVQYSRRLGSACTDVFPSTLTGQERRKHSLQHSARKKSGVVEPRILRSNLPINRCNLSAPVSNMITDGIEQSTKLAMLNIQPRHPLRFEWIHWTLFSVTTGAAEALFLRGAMSLSAFVCVPPTLRRRAKTMIFIARAPARQACLDARSRALFAVDGGSDPHRLSRPAASGSKQ